MNIMKGTYHIIVMVVSFLVVVSGRDYDDDHHQEKGGNNKGDYRHMYKNHGGVGLRMNFYGKSCKTLEKTVRDITWAKVSADPTMAAKLLRLHYHDCFVRGCDASILIDPLNSDDNTTEKNAIQNRSVKGYEVIDEIKEKLTTECPDAQISCADIVALTARDAVSYPNKKPLWPVFTGRRDGRVSLATEASRDLPSASSNFNTLSTHFARFNLDETDLVALSGAHTLGVTHCPLMFRRLYNFTGKGDTDPALNQDYATELMAKCPPPANPRTTVEMDPKSSLSFDSHYYVGLTEYKGAFSSDAALLTNRRAARLVRSFRDFNTFKIAFGRSMVHMGATGVLTGDEGEIRTNCRVIN
ncbi:peroxidase 24-like [Cannabis sativa]|uniref:peroxidase 24-like n=1 Tax=Cannabis sativa TaxID=3483 RepID=UPI0029CA9C9B|nr:peroxidase 24-like [Cannabis sativa]